MEEIKKTKTSFLNAVKGCFVGTQIFTDLKEQNAIRTIWHLLLICVISGVLAVFIGGKQISKQVTDVYDIINSYSGGIEVRDNGLYPKQNSDEIFDFEINSGNKIVYTPFDEKVDLKRALNSGITFFWTPKVIFMVTTNEQSPNFSVLTVNLSQAFKTKFFDNTQAFDEFVQQELEIADEVEISELKVDINSITTGISFMMFLRYMGEFFIVSIFISLFFALFYFITGVSKKTGMRFGEFFSISIYAGFPAIVIASLFIGFDLPFINYNTVQLFGWLIYLLVILSSLLNSSTNKKNN